MGSTIITSPQSARRKTDPHRSENCSKVPRKPTSAANIAVKRGQLATGPRMILTAENWPKLPSQVVTEVGTPPAEHFSSKVARPDDYYASDRGQQHTHQTLSRSNHEVSSPCTTEAVTPDVPYSPYFPFDSPPSNTGRSDETISPSSRQVSSRSSTGSPEIGDNSSEVLHTALGAGRLDPFRVYCKQDLSLEVHGILDHCLNHVCCSFTLASRPIELDKVKAYIMGHAMSDPITFYAIILAGVTHFIFSRGEYGVPAEIRMLRLSYKTQAIVEVRKDIERRRGKVTEAGLFAINTLAAHGGADFNKTGIPIDRLQEGKALGKANALNYYSAIETEWQHWNMFTKLMRQRGGPSTLEHSNTIRGFPPSPGPGCLTTTDVVIAWRNLRCPEFALSVGSEKVIDLQRLVRDPPAILLMQKLLSGFPPMPRNNMHSRRLTALLKKIKTLIVDFDQYQREQQDNVAGTSKVDIRLLYWTRLMLLHDLLLLPDLSLSDNPLELLYELCRNGALAFFQLVLVPIAATNRLPEKLLAQIIPLLHRCVTSIHGRTLDREHPSLFLWAVMLAGMLAMEHYVTHKDSALLDQVSGFFDRVSIKPEKNSWSMATGILRNFLWIDSECDGPGRRYWNYACLWLAERSHSEAEAAQSQAKRTPEWSVWNSA